MQFFIVTCQLLVKLKLIELITQYVHIKLDLINHSFEFLFLTLSLTQTKIITQKRKPSLENAKTLDSPAVNLPPTPLKDVGEPGPPQIVDMYDCYSVAEGWKFIFKFTYCLLNICSAVVWHKQVKFFNYLIRRHWIHHCPSSGLTATDIQILLQRCDTVHRRCSLSFSYGRRIQYRYIMCIQCQKHRRR